MKPLPRKTVKTLPREKKNAWNGTERRKKPADIWHGRREGGHGGVSFDVPLEQQTRYSERRKGPEKFTDYIYDDEGPAGAEKYTSRRKAKK